jgi:hypothetical protein
MCCVTYTLDIIHESCYREDGCRGFPAQDLQLTAPFGWRKSSVGYSSAASKHVHENVIGG